MQMNAADFFLALDQPFNLEGQLALVFLPGFDGVNARDELALVVAGPARIKIAVANRRLERRRLPQIQRLGRLHVVVVVDQEFASPSPNSAHTTGGALPSVGTTFTSAPMEDSRRATSAAISVMPWPVAATLGWRKKSL